MAAWSASPACSATSRSRWAAVASAPVRLGPLAVEAGIFAFLLLVVTSSAVAELHGRETANRLVLIGFVPLIVSLLLSLAGARPSRRP